MASKVPKEPPPSIYYDKDGGYVEILFDYEERWGDWIDPFLTVFRVRETREIVGFLLEGVRRLLEMKAPGLAAEIEDGKIAVTHLLRWCLWAQPRKPGSAAVQVYRKLIEEVEKIDARVEIPLSVKV